MILTVRPAHSLKGIVQLPASKSYSIRAFLVAACGGTSRIIHPSDSDDVKFARQAAQALGCRLQRGQENIWQVSASKKIRPRLTIDVGESGTALRFLLPLLALHPGEFVVTGRGTLKGRPNLHLVKTLRAMGATIHGQGRQESIPLRIQGGNLRGGRVEIDGTVSSQFVSALLLVCPQLNEETDLVITGERIVSTDYIAMTQQVLKEAGIKLKKISQQKYWIPGRQTFRGLKNFIVPSDYGLAAFWLAAGALIPSEIVLTGYLKENFLQADGAILPLLRRMGADFQKSDTSLRIRGPFRLRGGEFSLKDCPDLLPIMAVLALFAEGRTRFLDIGHARVKESDRISDLRGELLKIGARISESGQGMIIEPRREYRRNVLLDPHRDHRLAMALSILGLKLGVRIKDIECTRKSYPHFVRDLKLLGAEVKKSK